MLRVAYPKLALRNPPVGCFLRLRYVDYEEFPFKRKKRKKNTDHRSNLKNKLLFVENVYFQTAGVLTSQPPSPLLLHLPSMAPIQMLDHTLDVVP